MPDFLGSLNQDIKGVKIGIPREYFVEGLDSSVKDRIMAAAGLMNRHGAEIIDISLPHTSYAVSVYYLIATAEAISFCGATPVFVDIDEKTYNNEQTFRMNNFLLSSEEAISTRIPLGFNALLDHKSGGMQLTDLVLIGGMRGSGKSIVGVNIVCNQFDNGFVGLFFSIEMPGVEIYHRMMSVMSGVPHDRIRNNRLEQNDYNLLANVQRDFYNNSDSLYDKFLEDRDYAAFERHLIREKSLREDKQLIIIDNQQLTIADIDLHMHKAKAQFGENLRLVVVDYVNQIVPPGDDMYDWKTQIQLSKNLKNLARKHEVCVVSPYQIDKGGEARFAKGLLDAADIALNLEAQESSLRFTTTKCRGFERVELESKIDWETLKIHPDEFETVEKSPEDMSY